MSLLPHIVNSNKRKNRFKEIDNLSPEMRKVVHEWGYAIVKNFMNCGVVKPKHIRKKMENWLEYAKEAEITDDAVDRAFSKVITRGFQKDSGK